MHSIHYSIHLLMCNVCLHSLFCGFGCSISTNRHWKKIMDPHYVAHDSCPFIAQYGLQTLVLIPSHGCHLTQRHTDVHLMDEERHTDGDENVERITAVGNELKLHPKISKQHRNANPCTHGTQIIR
eukprot:149044_1